MNGIHPDAGALSGIVVQMKQSHLPHEARAEKLTEETLVPVVRPGVAQHSHYVPFAGDVRKPLAILVVGTGDDPLDVLHHGKAERIALEARKPRMVELGLEAYVGVPVPALTDAS